MKTNIMIPYVTEAVFLKKYEAIHASHAADLVEQPLTSYEIHRFENEDDDKGIYIGKTKESDTEWGNWLIYTTQIDKLRLYGFTSNDDEFPIEYNVGTADDFKQTITAFYDNRIYHMDDDPWTCSRRKTTITREDICNDAYLESLPLGKTDLELNIYITEDNGQDRILFSLYSSIFVTEFDV